ncbi:unnamed protein product [Thlaspi arvense]|uniref:MATH domain-containing protein n=1 Tax=Thlaspi arvense TaxID=13288 RepID=A0AAU9RYK1_THLAR|nr:unnamed protein product [Thlaspi arvense]
MGIMGSSAADSKIVKNWREQPPSSYSLKFDKLSHLNLDKYESRWFLSGGYNWCVILRLVIYPKGNESDNGSKFISMYVEFDNTSLTSTTTAECEFGVDVTVASPFTKWEVVSFDEEPSNPKFSLLVENFSLLKENPYVSNKFSVGGRKWVLELYPKGRYREDGKCLSIFLSLADSETTLEGEKIYVCADIRVLDPRGSNHDTKSFNRWYKLKPGQGWGWEEFVSIAKLREAYLDEDTLSVEVEFKVVSTTKCSPTT